MQADERLIALMREGHDWAFEALFNRYQPRLLAFCRRLVGSPQDAEDVLQEVFAAAHAAILANDRPINARPWLYRIARNRCLNHLRKPTAADGVDSMDVHPHEHGTSTLERVQQREELRAIVSDVHKLPKTQRTALTLRAIDDLSYTDITQAMGTTLPSVKSLLTRARTTLAESSHARGALAPLGLLALLRKLIPAKLGGGSGAGAAAGTAGSAGGATGTAATGIAGALGAKAAVGMATAVLFTAGAVSVDGMNRDSGPATARSGGAGASAATETTDGIRHSATSPPAGRRARANAPAGAPRSTAGAGSEGSAGSTAARPLVEPPLPVEAPAKPAPTEGLAAGTDRIVQAATSTGQSVLSPGASQATAATERVRASLRPLTERVLPPLGLGSGR